MTRQCRRTSREAWRGAHAQQAVPTLLLDRLVQLGSGGEPDPLVGGDRNKTAGLPASYRLDSPFLDLPYRSISERTWQRILRGLKADTDVAVV